MASLSLDTVLLLASEPHVLSRLSDFQPPVPEDRAKLDRFLAWFTPLAARADRLAGWEVIGEVLANSPYLETVARRYDARQIIANVRKLLALAADEPQLGPAEFAERIREIQQIRHREGDAPAGAEDRDEVSIMTIHKAKGLEFEVVVLPDTDEKLVRDGKELTIDPVLGLVATKFDVRQSLMYRLLEERRRTRDEEEALRVLYVALTRAKRRLCICMYPLGGTNTGSNKIRKAIGKSPPAGVLVRERPQPARFELPGASSPKDASSS